MKAITHAQKEFMLEYFRVLEAQLRRALQRAAEAGEPGRDAAFIDPLVKDIEQRVAAMAERVPGARPPTVQQIRKTLESVLDPAFFEDGRADPLKAVAVLHQQLRYQKVYTPPEGGAWRPGTARRPAGRRR